MSTHKIIDYMEFKGTKGPWEIMKYTALSVKNHEGRFIASAGGYADCTESAEKENEANALLIAAAPSLLEALQELMYGWESADPNHDVTESYRKAEQAINKALNGKS